jgi:pyrroline-5-carboxylate reductase
VCSPGGTTIEAIHELEKAGVRAGLINAVRASAEKSKKLGA